jgi:dienelactone hydrolase
MNRPLLSRRAWLRTSAAWCGAMTACDAGSLRRALAADPPASINRFPRMVHEDYVARVGAIMTRRAERLAGLKTKADAEAYVAEVREKIQTAFGPWPERTPLNARVTGVVERDAYRIEKVIFESRPQFFVTANLYVPKGLKSKAPGVVGSCGHSHDGKANATYQSFCQGLAQLGYVVLIFDPIGQGERLQLPDEHLKPRIGVGVPEHMMVGNSQFLTGEFFGSWRAWDGMRALDYLLSREEVDPQHVGITGNSGGGTMSTWLCGVESRWTMGAPSCFVTGFHQNLRNELAADTEQCPPRSIGQGLDHGDFLIAMAPKPIAIIGQEQDYFDARGLLSTYEQVRGVYRLLGAEEKVSHFIGANGHGYHQDGREAMYACFQRATGRGDGPVKEPELKLEEEATLLCTKSGQVAELQSRPVYSFTKDTAARLATDRGPVSGTALKAAVNQVLNLEPRPDRLEYRIARPRAQPDQSHLATYLVERGPGILVPVYRRYPMLHYSRPPQSDAAAILYVAHDSAENELLDEPLVREVTAAAPGAALYALDVRGLGESRPNTCGVKSYYTAYGCDYFYASYAVMLGESIVAKRVDDVLTAVEFIRREGGHRQVHVVAKGYGTIPAALASLLSDGIHQTTLKHPLTSYADIAGADVYKWPLSSFIPDVLKSFDLPDVYRELEATKQLRTIEPRGPEGVS